MSVTVKIDDDQIVSAFNKLLAAGRNQTRALQAMGRYGKTSTQLRFRMQYGPDFKRWKPSERVKEEGGQTLRLTGRLRNSLSWALMAGGVEWGTNVVYASAHQFGVDEPNQRVAGHYRRLRRRRFTKSGAAIVQYVAPHRRHMKIPKRPFLGVNDVDKKYLLDILRRELQQQVR